MPFGFLNISHNFAGNPDFVIVEWVRSTAQGVPVVGHVTGTGLVGGQNDTDQTQVYYPAPHVNEQLQIIELPRVWFLVRFWQSSDGVAKDLLLLTIAGNAKTGATYPITRLEYVVDRGYNNNFPVVTEGVWSDPVQDDTGLRDTRLYNQNYWIEERGTASLLTSEYTDRSDAGGGFDFVDAFKVMNSGAVYVVYIIERVEAAGDDSGSGVSDDEIYILDTDQAFNPVTMATRTLIADGATTVLTLSFGPLSGIADSRFKLQTHGGAQRNVVLDLDAGDTVDFMGAAVNQIILGNGEEIEILIKGGVMYVLMHDTNHERLGQIIWAYKQLINSLKADGTLLALADYPRVAELINSLPAASVVSEVTWQTSFLFPDGQTGYPNKGKFMSDGTNFRTPDWRDRSAKAVPLVDGSWPGGTYQHDAVKGHDHEMRGGFGFGQYDGGGNTFWRIRNTTDPFVADDIMATTGDADNKVKSILLYPLICI